MSPLFLDSLPKDSLYNKYHRVQRNASAMTKNVKWLSRHYDGRHFPLIPKGDKINLPRSLIFFNIRAEPPMSSKRESNIKC